MNGGGNGCNEDGRDTAGGGGGGGGAILWKCLQISLCY